ncbi:hypothetical protein FCM35_KLT17001 [Carex littledalei]|uniref:Uncharacterized protein n=1 Tax=Carex littledalei TaxID=544730 RepID=A0A833QW87_9POAL|nr:hypothetical protein FCM35_KLT05864 [Carex littledalei]KAF3339530.1 hypothetical protein FCM35_KLT17001 [Carex littledalei]
MVMVACCRQYDEVVDPIIEMQPSTRPLERELLTALDVLTHMPTRDQKYVQWYACLTLMSLSIFRCIATSCPP